ADEWKVYSYPDEGFAAEFPRVPKRTDFDARKNLVRLVQYFTTDEDGNEYLGQAMLLRPYVRAYNALETIFRLSIDGAKNTANCRIRSERNFPFSGALAREVIYEKCINDAVGRSYFVLRDDWMYLVLAMGRPGIENGPDAERFVKSLRLI